jgi:hypothetical protein
MFNIKRKERQVRHVVVWVGKKGVGVVGGRLVGKEDRAKGQAVSLAKS